MTMGQKKADFVFVDDLSAITTGQDFVVNLPSGIGSQGDLFATYQTYGKFPTYFGKNWDALLDCLRDWSWTRHRRVVIAHADLPLAKQRDELRVYLDILKTAVRDWKTPNTRTVIEPPVYMPYIEHELVVVFPAALEKSITEAMDS